MSEPMKDEDLVSLVNAEFEQALGAPGGDISMLREKLWHYYFSEPDGDEEEGESKVVPSDVADIVDGYMPSLLRIFTIADNLLSFDPVGQEDEPAAAQESDYVSYVFFKRNPAFLVLFYWFFDALLQINGIVKAWWDESEEVSTEEYEGLTYDEMLEVLGDEEIELLDQTERPGETIDPLTGQLVAGTVYDIECLRTTKLGRARVENVPGDEYRISADSNSVDPNGARMVGHEREFSRSQLIEMNFDEDLVNSLQAEQISPKAEKVARDDKSDEQKGGAPATSKDKAQDKFILREAYTRVDADGDGRAELVQTFTVGDTLMRTKDGKPCRYMCDRQPFHVLCPHPLPHKHFGRSAGEKVIDLQDINKTLWRQTLMNLYHSNQPGHAVWEQGMGENTLDDLLTTRIGRVARFSRPISESYQPMTVPFTAQHSFPMLEYVDKVKRDRTGVRADSEALSPESLKHIQTTVLGPEMEKAMAKVETIARVFAETGIKSLFLHLHELLQKHQRKTEVVKLRGRWERVSPTEWRTRRDMTVNIGLGIGTREQNLIHLEAIWNKQVAMLERGFGNLTVTPQNLYRTAAEFVKNANLKLPALFFADPGNNMAPPPNPEQLKLQEQQQQLAAREQQIEERRQALDAQKANQDRQEMVLEHQRELAEIRRKSDADKDRYALENEELRNQLLEIRLKYSQPSTA